MASSCPMHRYWDGSRIVSANFIAQIALEGKEVYVEININGSSQVVTSVILFFKFQYQTAGPVKSWGLVSHHPWIKEYLGTS